MVRGVNQKSSFHFLTFLEIDYPLIVWETFLLLQKSQGTALMVKFTKDFLALLPVVILLLLQISCGGGGGGNEPSVNAVITNVTTGSPVALEEFQVTASRSTASEGAIVSYVWEAEPYTIGYNTSNEESFTFTPLTIGPVTITLTVRTDENESATTTKTVGEIFEYSYANNCFLNTVERFGQELSPTACSFFGQDVLDGDGAINELGHVAQVWQSSHYSAESNALLLNYSYFDGTSWHTSVIEEMSSYSTGRNENIVINDQGHVAVYTKQRLFYYDKNTLLYNLALPGELDLTRRHTKNIHIDSSGLVTMVLEDLDESLISHIVSYDQNGLVDTMTFSPRENSGVTIGPKGYLTSSDNGNLAVLYNRYIFRKINGVWSDFTFDQLDTSISLNSNRSIQFIDEDGTYHLISANNQTHYSLSPTDEVISFDVLDVDSRNLAKGNNEIAYVGHCTTENISNNLCTESGLTLYVFDGTVWRAKSSIPGARVGTGIDEIPQTLEFIDNRWVLMRAIPSEETIRFDIFEDSLWDRFAYSPVVNYSASGPTGKPVYGINSQGDIFISANYLDFDVYTQGTGGFRTVIFNLDLQ